MNSQAQVLDMCKYLMHINNTGFSNNNTHHNITPYKPPAAPARLINAHVL